MTFLYVQPCLLTVGHQLWSSSSVYAIQEFIGEGCFGKVARCINLATQDIVAVKILKDSSHIENVEKEVGFFESCCLL